MMEKLPLGLAATQVFSDSTTWSQAAIKLVTFFLLLELLRNLQE
jgi:hypothetical protein